jgi:PadR family transcriptional regulator, regulatory protein PadR
VLAAQLVARRREGGMAVDLIQGKLDMLILKALTWGPMHGYAVARWLQQTTDDELLLEEGTLYPALHRMEKRRWVKSEWGVSENNRRAKFYTLTAAGRAQLRVQASAWERLATIVAKVMAAEPAAAR